MARVEITDKGFGRGTVHVDGHDISKAVQAVTVNVDARKRPEVELELGVHEIGRLDVEDAQVAITDDTRDALIALGWRPPPPPGPSGISPSPGGAR